MRVVGAAFAAVVVLALAGCVNGYEQFYQPNVLPPPPSAQVLNFNGEPRIFSLSGDDELDMTRLFADGYGPIGFAAFLGPVGEQADVIAQAKRVGAAIVLISTKYQSTATGAVPYTTTTPQTVYTSGIGNTGGAASGLYSRKFTTYTTQTTMVPYSVDRYDNVAVFFKPIERKGFGALLRAPTPQQQRNAGTNKGVTVRAVRQGSPAFQADVLAGDLLLTVNGRPIDDEASAATELIAARSGTATLVILRDGRQITKAISIPSGAW